MNFLYNRSMIVQNSIQILKNIPAHNAFGEKITVLAATKRQSVQNIQKAISAGITAIGENTVQELLQKEDLLQTCTSFAPLPNSNPPPSIQRHFIGKLQRNKVKYLVNKVDLLHSLDSIALALEIERQGEKHNWICPCLLQVNIAKEVTKNGFLLDEVETAYLQCIKLKHVKLCGLMTILPKNENHTKLFNYAKQMRLLFDQFKAENRNFQHLSMGMSNDYTLCIEAGSNMLRLGTAIFGSR